MPTRVLSASPLRPARIAVTLFYALLASAASAEAEFPRLVSLNPSITEIVVALGALPEGVHHPRVVLVRGEDLVAVIEIYPELADLEAFGRVAGECDFFGIDARGEGKALSEAFSAGFEDAP